MLASQHAHWTVIAVGVGIPVLVIGGHFLLEAIEAWRKRRR